MRKRDFLKSKLFFKHLLLIVLSFFALLFIVMQVLKIYTRHGKEYEVPKITDRLLQEVANSEEMTLFDIFILDSIYREDLRPGTILTQDPNPGTMVKKGRKIYITVVAFSGEIVSMPSCSNVSLKTAVQNLVDKGLRVGTLIFRNADISGEAFVVEQRFKGQTIRAGAEIQSGESVDLIVEVPSTTATIKIPDILGKTEKEAELMLWKAGLNVGTKQYEGEKDSQQMRVVTYSPLANTITIGQSISLNFMNENNRKYKKQINEFREEKNSVSEQEQINAQIEEQIGMEEWIEQSNE
ncbi:MAG: PASTA domain-containing protein [Bacteroidota bacterium]|nr:PASTA domain-containing protein [Bacteroidota bacterium]